VNPKRRTPNPALTKLGYRTYFETDAFLQLQAPENFPPLDLMVVDDQTFDRIEATADQKMLDGQQIRIPDALRLIALKLHATRDTARRTTETDWQDIASLLRVTNRNLEDPELRLIIAQYGGPTALAEIQRRVRNS
jgi:hypothetical protein